MKKLVFGFLLTLSAYGVSSAPVAGRSCCLKATITEGDGKQTTIHACAETCGQAGDIIDEVYEIVK